MSRQQTNHEVLTEAQRRNDVFVQLRRYVRRTAPRKAQRDAAIARAATVDLTADKQRAARG